MGIKISPKSLFREHPYMDIKPILVLFNKGSFSGAKLGKFIGKIDSGTKVAEWYKEKDYASIQKYIEDEANRFINLYQFLVQRLPDIWLEYAKIHKLII
jgi:hypothetical protein